MKKILEMFGEPILRGGQESFVINTIQHMKLDGMQIDLLTPYYCRNAYYKQIVNNLGGDIYALDNQFNPGSSRKNIIPSIEKFFKAHHYDIVHIHSGSISVLAYGAMVARKAGVQRVIVHSHSSGEKKSLKHELIKIYAAPIFKKYATDFCACSLSAAEWKFPKKICNNDVIVLRNGVDVEKFRFNESIRQKMRKELGLEDYWVVGHVGRFTEEKNQIYLIHVFEKLLKNDHNIKLVFVGEGEELSFVKREAKDRDLLDKVIFVGGVDNVSDYMQAFDIFTLPSLYEGFGNVAVEAQASGLPVISSDRVPQDINLTGNVEYLPLEDSGELWADKILKFRNFERSDTSNIICKCGYDINETAKQVTKLYS